VALATAGIIVLYTFVDGIGVRLSQSPVAYTMWGFLLTALPLLGWVAWRRPRATFERVRSNWMIALGGGACTLASYSLALWAMTQAAIAPVAALRETSILFGMLLASFALKERFGWARPAAAAILVCGVVALRLG
jgi:drug/metabolite transporter (DMT)-like permease